MQPIPSALPLVLRCPEHGKPLVAVMVAAKRYVLTPYTDVYAQRGTHRMTIHECSPERGRTGRWWQISGILPAESPGLFPKLTQPFRLEFPDVKKREEAERLVRSFMKAGALVDASQDGHTADMKRASHAA